MGYKSDTKNNCFVIVITILLMSFIINIYQAVVNNEYKNELGQLNYSKIEEIRYRNEAVLSTLEGCITANSINNEELLSLYRNYTEITDAEVSLWEAYLDNDNNKLINYNNKKVNIAAQQKNELYWQIEELIYAYLQNDMKENTFSMELKGKALTDFETLKNLSLDLNNYFIDFYENNCKDLVDEKKKEKMVKENFWIDILEGIQEVNNKYIDYSFVY